MFKFLHRHKWKSLFFSSPPFFHATRQECRCGLVRKIKEKNNNDVVFHNPKHWLWEYSDGTETEFTAEY